LTGAAQLRQFGLKTMTAREVYRKYRLDRHYARHQSVGYDLLILFRTARLWTRLLLTATAELLTRPGTGHGS
jgi:lipopolysaccharide/colanic/teichoic acid biosynthesis glycosyltransferase